MTDRVKWRLTAIVVTLVMLAHPAAWAWAVSMVLELLAEAFNDLCWLLVRVTRWDRVVAYMLKWEDDIALKEEVAAQAVLRKQWDDV